MSGYDREHPMVIPGWAADQVRAAAEGEHGMVDWAKRGLADGFVIEARMPADERSGVTPGGIPWRITG